MPDDYPIFTDPQGNSPGSTMAALGSMFGGRGLVGRGLSAFGTLANRHAYEQFEQANRPKQLDLFERHGLISKEDRPYYEQLPTAAWEPIGQSYQQRMDAVQKQAVPVPYYNQQTNQIEYVAPQAGMKLPPGLLPPSMYNAQQSQQEKEKAQQEHEREFGITKDLQEKNFDVSTGLRREGIESNNAMRQATLANTQAQQGIVNELARQRIDAATQGQYSKQENDLRTRQHGIAALQAAGKTDPDTLGALQKQLNTDMDAFQQKAKQAGYPTSVAPPLAVKEKPGLLKRAFGYGPSSSSLVPAPIAPIAPIPSGLSAPGAPEFKPGDRRTKNGRIYQRDAVGRWHPVTS